MVRAEGIQLDFGNSCNIIPLPGSGSRAETAMNSSQYANAFTLAEILSTSSISENG
jgi:hypothetical protein